MREMYIILGLAGWIWFGVVLILLLVGFLFKSRRTEAHGFEVIVKDEKQS